MVGLVILGILATSNCSNHMHRTSVGWGIMAHHEIIHSVANSRIVADDAEWNPKDVTGGTGSFNPSNTSELRRSP